MVKMKKKQFSGHFAKLHTVLDAYSTKPGRINFYFTWKKYIPEKKIFSSHKIGKTRGEQILKSDDGLLIHKLTTTTNTANWAGYIGAY